MNRLDKSAIECMPPENIKVTAYSGYKANERPISFKWRDRTLQIQDIIDRWYGPGHDYFKVRADDGNIYIIRWDRYLDIWRLEKVLERTGSLQPIPSHKPSCN